jgi:dTDP-glucose 4,6-dehydratase
MKYLVLGSNSFAGACLVEHLLNEEHEVIGISRSKQPHPTLLAYAKNTKLNQFKFHSLDVNQNLDEIKQIIQKEKPAYIVDLAGQGMVAESWKNPEQWYQTNIIAKVKLHDFLRQCDFLERYVRVSTPEVYGQMDASVAEDQAFNPSTPYAVSHAAVDMSLLAFHRQYDFPVVLTRFANFYGPHQQLYRIIPRTILYSLMGKQLQLHGGGTSMRAFIYGDDVARGINAAIQKGRPGETYHFSSEQVVSIADLVRKLCDLMQIKFEDFVNVSPERPGKDALYSMEMDKAQKELAWLPKTTLEQGLDKTIAWARSNFEVIETLPLEYIHKA